MSRWVGRPGPDDPDARPVHHVTDALGVISSRLGLGDPVRNARATTAWADVAGPMIAAHTTARGVRSGTLTVEVDGPEWVTELRYRESDLVARLTERVGPGVVERVRFVVGRPGTRR